MQLEWGCVDCHLSHAWFHDAARLEMRQILFCLLTLLIHFSPWCIFLGSISNHRLSRMHRGILLLRYSLVVVNDIARGVSKA